MSIVPVKPQDTFHIYPMAAVLVHQGIYSRDGVCYQVYLLEGGKSPAVHRLSTTDSRIQTTGHIRHARDDEVLLAGPDFNTVKGAIPVHVRHPLFLL